jgi:hypothetical protein
MTARAAPQLNAVWARDGRELYYWTDAGGTVTIMAVPILAGLLFSIPIAPTGVGRGGLDGWDARRAGGQA